MSLELELWTGNSSEKYLFEGFYPLDNGTAPFRICVDCYPLSNPKRLVKVAVRTYQKRVDRDDRMQRFRNDFDAGVLSFEFREGFEILPP